MTPFRLRDQLTRDFNKSELRNLCFDLGIDYEDLAGETIRDTARELVAYCHRHGQDAALIEHCQKLRPQTSWQDLMGEGLPDGVVVSTGTDSDSRRIEEPVGVANGIHEFVSAAPSKNEQVLSPLIQNSADRTWKKPTGTQSKVIAAIIAGVFPCIVVIFLCIVAIAKLGDPIVEKWAEIQLDDTPSPSNLFETPMPTASSPTQVTPTANATTSSPQVSDFDDWQIPSGHDGYVEYRRCSGYPNDSFPVLDANTPGYIHLIPQSAKKENGNYTWCFEVQSTGYSSSNLAVYFCAPPVSGFCAEPGRVTIPSEAVVSVDNDSCVLSPVIGNRNGVSIQSPRIIRVTLPGSTTQEPTITVGPCPNDDASYIACP